MRGSFGDDGCCQPVVALSGLIMGPLGGAAPVGGGKEAPAAGTPVPVIRTGAAGVETLGGRAVGA